MLNKKTHDDYPLVMMVYPLYHFTARLFSFICMNDTHMGSRCVLTLAIVASVVIMRRLLNRMCPNASVRQKYVLDFLAVFYLIFATFAGSLTDGRIYARQCGPNPWHNPTITFVRPFGLIALLYFVKYVDGVKKHAENTRDLIIFSIFSAISVLAKTSFMMSFLSAMGIAVFLYWMKDFRRRFPFALRMLISVLPPAAI